MLHSIHFCRGIAALLVVLFHSAGNLAKDKYFGTEANPLEKIFWFGGEAGVDFFFVLSGFIIHHVHRQDFDNPRKLYPYLRKRIVRIYPTYLIVFCGVYFLAKLTPSLRDTMPDDIIVLVKSLLLLPQDSKVVGGTGAPVLVVAWSLQYEMFFYAVFATALLNRWIYYLMVLLFSANVMLEPWVGPYEFPQSFVSSHLILLFGMGIIASKATSRIYVFSYAGIMAVMSTLTFFAIAVMVTSLRESYSKPLFDLIYGFVSATLIFALVQYEKHRKKIDNINQTNLLGDSSYALYLLHFPLVAILSKIAIVVLPKNIYGVWVAFFFLVLGSVSVAMLFHKYFERPLLLRLTPNSNRK